MSCLFRAYYAAVLSKTDCLGARCSLSGFSTFSWKRKFDHVAVKTVNLEFLLTRFRIHCYSTRRSGKGSKASSRKLDPQPAMEEKKDKKDAFFVVRKGDIVGVYKSLTDCQAQVGASICDPPVSVYKGYSMPKDTEQYLVSCGLKNALYTIRAADLKEDIFGALIPCPLQRPSSSNCDMSGEVMPKKRSLEVLGSGIREAAGSTSILNDPLRKHAKLDYLVQGQVLSSRGCILEFDGASKGNPGQAGAGAVLRANDGSLICRLREGLGVATNNFAEYRAMILGLKYALKKGFTSIHVLGDSKLVCMQIQGLWKVKNQNMSDLYEQAKKLKDKFLSFDISHVLRELNTEADAQANLAIHLADGEIQEDM